MSDTATTLLPDGTEWILRQAYTTREAQGVTVLVVISCISLIFVAGLLAAIALSAFNTRSSLDKHLFVRTHVAAYFVSLIVSDLIQAIGSILNSHWVREMAVEVGSLCTAQGVLKQTADVATAFWTLVIAIHTFCLLFLEIKSSRFTLIATMIAGWSGIFAIVIAGPAALNISRHGPFYGVSGYWCWINENYPASRVTLDYMFMFIAAVFSFILYTLIFLRMRGNILVEGRRISFRFRNVSQWRGKRFESQALTIARQMLLYPVAYTILILPIAASRFSSFSGDNVPFGVTIFSAAVFLLSGIVNVTLFIMTRRILPPDSFRIPKWKISKPQPIPELPIVPGTDSYYRSAGAYSQSNDEKEKDYAQEETFDPMPPPLRIHTADPDQQTITLAKPLAVAHRDDPRGSEDMYNPFSPTSAIPLTPDDAASHPHHLV